MLMIQNSFHINFESGGQIRICYYFRTRPDTSALTVALTSALTVARTSAVDWYVRNITEVRFEIDCALLCWWRIQV